MGAIMKQSLLAAAATSSVSAILPPASIAGQYWSRPDLSPPQLNITVPAPDATGTEYVFVGPYAMSTPGIQRPGAYIYRKDGDLVWASTGYYAGLVANFHPTTYQGETVLQAFQGSLDLTHGTGYGQHILLDQNYQHVVTAIGGNHRVPSLHEFNVVNGETALIEIYVPTLANLTEYGGNSSQQWIGNGLFQEFDIRTGALVFEWSALDHVSPSDSLIPLNYVASNSGLSTATTWDFIHINSVDKDTEGHYLVSARHTSTIYKINGTDGTIIWRLGGSKSSFTHVGDWTFGFQHHARWQSQSKDGNTEVLSLFDNADSGAGTSNKISRALVIEIDHAHNTATVLRKAEAPYSLLATSQGNAQVLPDERIFVNWGSAGAVTEFGAENEILYHAFIENAVSYRGFLANWTGTPVEDPALVVLQSGSASVDLYVSWNGDTETGQWRFYSTDANDSGHGKGTLIGQETRQSFETTLRWTGEALSRVQSGNVKFFAEAIGKDGKVLARTLPVASAPYYALT